MLQILLMQGYSSKDRKGGLFEDWDLLDNGASETSQVCIFLLNSFRIFHIIERKHARSSSMSIIHVYIK